MYITRVQGFFIGSLDVLVPPGGVTGAELEYKSSHTWLTRWSTQPIIPSVCLLDVSNPIKQDQTHFFLNHQTHTKCCSN